MTRAKSAIREARATDGCAPTASGLMAICSLNSLISGLHSKR